MAKILLVEDDPDLSSQIVTYLGANRMTVDSVNCLSQGREFARAASYDAIVLDWNLPDGSGLSLLDELRQEGQATPVIMFTTRSDIEDKVSGFGSGADDYLTKPFYPQELLARLHALLRRPGQMTATLLCAGNVALNVTANQVTKNGQPVHLTKREFALLEFLLRHRQQAFSADSLLERVWKTDSESTGETVVATVHRLRKKIDEPNKPTLIRNISGVGYIMD